MPTDRPTVEEACQELWAELPGHYPIGEHLDALIAAARREGAQQMRERAINATGSHCACANAIDDLPLEETPE